LGGTKGFFTTPDRCPKESWPGVLLVWRLFGHDFSFLLRDGDRQGRRRVTYGELRGRHTARIDRQSVREMQRDDRQSESETETKKRNDFSLNITVFCT